MVLKKKPSDVISCDYVARGEVFVKESMQSLRVFLCFLVIYDGSRRILFCCLLVRSGFTRHCTQHYKTHEYPNGSHFSGYDYLIANLDTTSDLTQGVWGLGFGVWGLGFGRSEER